MTDSQDFAKTAQHSARDGAPFAVTGAFETPEALVEAIRQARSAGYTHMDTFTPFPLHEVYELLEPDTKTLVPLITLTGGILGSGGAFLMQYWISAVNFPLNVGGRPLFSWPAFMPITFELGVLVASIFAIVGMAVLNGLPRPHHPVFEAQDIERATDDRFFLCIEAEDPLFDSEGSAGFLRELGAESVDVVYGESEEGAHE